MSTHRNFLYWNIGFTRAWPVRCPASALPEAGQGRFHRWGQVSDGPQLTFQAEGKGVPLSFPNPALAREVRQALRQASPPVAFRIRLEQDAERSDRWTGELELVQTSLQASIEGSVGIVFPEALWPGVSEPERQQRLAGIRAALAFECGGRPVLVVEAPLLSIEPASGAPRLDLILDDRRRLRARIEGVPGQQCLVVESIQDPRGTAELRTGRLISLQREPVLTFSESAAPRTDLTTIVPPTQELLRAWLKYEGLERERDQVLFERRHAHPLEFNEMEASDSQGFDVAIVNATDVEQWLGDGMRLGGRLNIAVQVSAMAGNEAPRPALLERFIERKEEGRLLARLSFESEADRPPGIGRILARENKGSAAARKRRAKVLARLQTGRFANPRLLEYLLDPSRVQRVTAKLETFLRQSGKKSLEPKQVEAIAKATRLPDVLLIQGPPGTGKTEVLVEIVHHLRARYGGRREEASGPFRVLIAGAHNEAVKNAFSRLEGMVIRVLTAERQEQDSLKEKSALRGQEIARKARARIEGSDTFQRIRAQGDLREKLLMARRALVDAGMEEARPRFEELMDAALERHLTVSHQREIQTLSRRLDALRDAEGSTPTQVAGGAGVAAALQRLYEGPIPAPGEDPAPLLPLLSALDAARDAAVSGQERLPEELLVQADAWLALRPRIEQVVREGCGWSASLHMRVARLLQETAVPPEPLPPAEGPPTAHAEALRSVERDCLAWCDEALRLVAAQLEQLTRTDEVVLDQWIRALSDEPGLFHELQSKHAPISAATCQIAADTTGEEDDFFDVVIVDEAARAGIDVLIPMALGRHVILVGDHRQLPPHVEEQLWRGLDGELQSRVDMKSSLFAWLHARLPGENFVALDKQFRMHEDIGRLVSMAFYEPEVELRHYWEGALAEQRKLTLGLFDNRPVMWVDTRDRPGKDEDCLEFNAYEEDVIFKLLEAIPRERLDALRVKHGAPPIAVLAFYTQQRQRFEERLARLPSWLREAVDLITVHSAQGREFPLVIIATTRSTRKMKIGFLRDESSANVAISRAQSQVIIVGDSETLAAEQRGRANAPWRKVFGLISDAGARQSFRPIIPASEVLAWIR
ncbi:putative DNA helicase [Corallococcus coralloides]|uniref:Putative DNA helicase n=1 Tax=Corallococcus coralloides TaxID=184914 RepID=A0A410RR53_CORCK|nr:AAA domain-containing protein [Corallococcus coralloides]QAT84366.1 putative DNA helicase [Corallococcus coralloides]